MKRSIAMLVILMLVSPLIPMVTALPMDQSLANADLIFSAATATGGLGAHVDIIGDVNGDGFDDLIMADPWNDTWRGNVYLFFGRASGWDTDLSKANVTFDWSNQGDYLGVVEGAGDVNGDGFDDFLIGMPDAENPLMHTGVAHLFFGKPGGWGKFVDVGAAADASIWGEQMFEMVGRVLAGLGDVNGDGFDDFAIGRYGWDKGWIHVFYGSQGGWNTTMNLTHADASFHGREANSFAGFDIDGGDVNGDGLDDMVIGAPGNDFVMANYKIPGDVYVVFGKESGWGMNVNLTTGADASLEGEHWDDYLGNAVAVAGDVNGDGFEDILAGTPYNDEIGVNSGKAYLYLGHRDGWTMDFNVSNSNASYRGEGQFDQAGKRLSGAGDVDGDGFSDFLIGAPINDEGGMTSQGQTYLFLGKASGWAKDTNLATADGSWIGEQTADWSPDSLAGKGDVNNDGVDDIFIGSQNMGNQGRAYLIFPFPNMRPSEVTGVELFSDQAMTKGASYAKRNDTIHVKLTATDADAANASVAEVKVHCMPHDLDGFIMDVKETGVNTGVFIGNFTISNRTHETLRAIKALPISKVRVTSVSNSSAWDEVSVGGGLTIELFALQNNGDPILFAEKRAYEFRARVNDTMGHVHLDHVNLSFPLATGKINYTWTYKTNSFQETSDPGFFARLDGASFTDLINENETVIHFRVFFNFSFPDEMYHTVALTAVTKDMDTESSMLVDAYRVENDLDFLGDIEVRGKNNRLLHDGDALSPAEPLTFTNAVVVYQGTTDVSPPDGVFDVAVVDDDGNSWVDPQSTGAFFFVEAEATNGTDATEVFNVTITGVPEECINSSYSISFIVDGDEVTFSGAGPSSDIWQATKTVMATINVTDVGGSMVNGNSIEYRVKTDGGNWGTWTAAGFSGLASYVEATAIVNLNDGPANAVQWRATDGVGNVDPNGNKTESDLYPIKVDTVPPELSAEWPISTNVSKVLDVSFGIKIIDQWALVDGASIEYTLSTDDQATWSNWTNAGYTGTDVMYLCSATGTLVNGSTNWVSWRASDTLGNGPSVSEPMQIFVDTTGPTPGNHEPVIQALEDVILQVGEVFERDVVATDEDGDALTWELINGPTGMSISPGGKLRFTPTDADIGEYDVTVRVFDGLDDVFGTFKLKVILMKPSIAISNIGDLLGVLSRDVTVEGTATAGLGNIQKVEYSIDGGTWIPATGTTVWSFTIDTETLDDGAHQLSIRAIDDGSTSDTVDVTMTTLNENIIKPPPVDDWFAAIFLGLLIAVIFGIIIVVVVVVVIIMLLKKKRAPPPVQPQPPVQPPPPAQQQMYQQQQYQQPPPQQPPSEQPTTEPPPPQEHYQPPPQEQAPAPGPEQPQAPPPEGGQVQQPQSDEQQQWQQQQ